METIKMTHRAKPPFRADHVGSFLRPAALLEARAKRKKGEIGAEQRRRASRGSLTTAGLAMSLQRTTSCY